MNVKKKAKMVTDKMVAGMRVIRRRWQVMQNSYPTHKCSGGMCELPPYSITPSAK